jgi:hypothetical protein
MSDPELGESTNDPPPDRDESRPGPRVPAPPPSDGAGPTPTRWVPAPPTYGPGPRPAHRVPPPPTADTPVSEPARWVPPPPVSRSPRARPLPPSPGPGPGSAVGQGFDPLVHGRPAEVRPAAPSPNGTGPHLDPPAGTLLTAPRGRPLFVGDMGEPGRILIDERYLDDAPRLRRRHWWSRPRVVEAFRGPRLRSRTGWWRRIRSIVFLLVVTVFVALIVAGVLAAVVGGISYGISHAINNK